MCRMKIYVKIANNDIRFIENWKFEFLFRFSGGNWCPKTEKCGFGYPTSILEMGIMYVEECFSPFPPKFSPYLILFHTFAACFGVEKSLNTSIILG